MVNKSEYIVDCSTVLTEPQNDRLLYTATLQQPSKLPLSTGESRPPWFLGPPESASPTQTPSRSVRSFCMVNQRNQHRQTDTQTDHTTPFIAIGHYR